AGIPWTGQMREQNIDSFALCKSADSASVDAKQPAIEPLVPARRQTGDRRAKVLGHVGIAGSIPASGRKRNNFDCSAVVTNGRGSRLYPADCQKQVFCVFDAADPIAVAL